MVGKVIGVEEDTFKIHYWKGGYNKTLEPHNHHNHQPWTDELPKSCILLCNFELEADRRLGAGTKKYLRERYREIKEKQ